MSETAEEYAKRLAGYAARNPPLDLQAIVRVLKNTVVVVRQRLMVLPEHAAAWHPAPDKWCIRQIIGHLIEEDKRDFVGRIQAMLEADEPALDVNDENGVARDRQDCDRETGELLDEFDQERGRSIGFLWGLRVSDLERGGIHPKIGRISIGELLHEWIYHDLHHVRQMDANVQSYLWGKLGNLQEFYRT